MCEKGKGKCMNDRKCQDYQRVNLLKPEWLIKLKKKKKKNQTGDAPEVKFDELCVHEVFTLATRQL